MDHEVIARPCKICDWLLNSSHDHFGLHPKKNVKVAMGFEVPKRRMLRPTSSIDVVQRVLPWKRQKRHFKIKIQGPMAKKYCSNKLLLIFFSKEKNRWRQKNMSNLNFFFLNCPFWSYIRKKLHIHLLMHGHCSWFTPSEGPKSFANQILKKSDHQVRPWTKGHLSMVQLHGRWCKAAGPKSQLPSLPSTPILRPIPWPEKKTVDR